MVAATEHTERGTGAAPVRLRVERFDALTAAAGAETETAQAALMDTDRKSLWRYKAHKVTPSAELAMRWAQRLDTTVEDLWERVA